MNDVIVISREALSQLLDEKLKPLFQQLTKDQETPVIDTDNMTSREVMDTLRCCRQSLFNYEAEGLLHPIRVTPRKKIYNRSEVMKLLK